MSDARNANRLLRRLALTLLTLGVLTGNVALADNDGDDRRERRSTDWDDDDQRKSASKRKDAAIQLGPRPYYLVDEMTPSRLKQKLESCAHGPFQRTDWSIGHRGAALQFPEHTLESYKAAARMGAGILECDVTFTSDRQLVCRHDQCDLHTTTNILATDLAPTCEVPFTPAQFDDAGNRISAATARCCSSAITLAEFRTLCGKMDASDPNATTVEEYLGGTADFRTDLYATCGTLMTHAQSIKLFAQLGAKFTPELKSPAVPMPYEGDYTQQDYAQQMIDEYKAAGIRPRDVWAQSFNLEDVLYWIENEPRFGRQAVYLDDRVYTDPAFVPTLADFRDLRARGVRIVAPPMFALLTLDAHNRIVPSDYARLATEAGLDIITWTTERSGRIIEDMKNGAGGTFYYQSILDAVNNDGAIMEVLDVLAKKVEILGIFSDWPATTTYYANCMGLD